MIMIDSDMPDNCVECRLSTWDGEGYACPFSGIPALNIGRQVDCPLIEPEERWIPVSERPPEEDGDYLVTFKMLFLRPVEVCTFTDGQWDKGGYEKVLAWQPLPESYRGK